MFKATSIQMVTTLMEQTRLKKEEGLLLALYPDFILMIRPGMTKDEWEDAADALLDAAENLSLPVMDPLEYEDGDDDDSLSIPPDLLEEAGFLGLDYDDDLAYTVENGRIIIEREDY